MFYDYISTVTFEACDHTHVSTSGSQLNPEAAPHYLTNSSRQNEREEVPKTLVVGLEKPTPYFRSLKAFQQYL